MNEYIIFAIALLILDLPFINFVMKPDYLKIGLMDTFRVHGAMLAYVSMALSWFFIKGDVVHGILVGLSLFSVYVFTLYAIYKKYTLVLALKELVWGGILYGVATYLTNHFVGLK